MDPVAIFVLIAGSFTPVHSILFTGWGRWGVLPLVWSLALTGVTLKVIFFNRIPEWLSLAIYLGLGWTGLAPGIMIWRGYDADLVKPLVYSGLSDTFGSLLEFFRVPVVILGVIGLHELLHFGVLAGIGFHFRFLFGVLNRLNPGKPQSSIALNPTGNPDGEVSPSFPRKFRWSPRLSKRGFSIQDRPSIEIVIRHQYNGPDFNSSVSY
ncbi:MAG: hemolysin III family protein [Gammaproteobacteria bacterium]